MVGSINRSLFPPLGFPALPRLLQRAASPHAPLEKSHVASGWAEAAGLRADYFTLPCAPWAVVHPHSYACEV